jgi:hypothetical protein
MLRFFAAFAMLAMLAVPASAQKNDKVHRLVIQVSENDAAKMNLALNNVVNVSQYYTGKGEEVEIEVVAYGPGLHMLRADTSPVKQRIMSVSQSMPSVSFSACGNTMEGMKKAENVEKIELLPKIEVVSAGVTRIIELQEKGWSYVKP